MDTLVLTLACGKYRFNDLDLGDIDGIPRILDMGQCNDSYSAIKVALALADAFNCSINDLPLTLVLSWYEQKAVCILLTLLSLGVRNMYIGPTLPAFMSETVVKYLVENYKLNPITAPEQDMDAILKRCISLILSAISAFIPASCPGIWRQNHRSVALPHTRHCPEQNNHPCGGSCPSDLRRQDSVEP